MSKRAFIFAAGTYTPEDLKLYRRIKFKEDDVIVCADGGYDAIYYTNIIPTAIIGDLDSVRFPLPSNAEIIRYPTEKDKTDLEICIDYIKDKECDTLFILGALGGRLDHILGCNYALEYAMNLGINAMILCGKTRVYLVKDKIELDRETFDYVSLIPCTTTVTGVTTQGLKYPLENAELKRQSSYGISNEFYNNKAEVSIKSGLLFVICVSE